MAANQVSVEVPDVDPQNMELLISLGGLLNNKAIHDMTIPQQREVFRQAQSPAAKNPGVAVSHSLIDTSYGKVKSCTYQPQGVAKGLPFVYFIHGGGFIVGSAFEWEAFIFDLVTRTKMAVVFPEYTLAPEMKFPAQLEQCLEVFQYLISNGNEHGLGMNKVVLASDRVGGMRTLCEVILSAC